MMQKGIQQQKSVAMMPAMRRCILAAWCLTRLFCTLPTLVDDLDECLTIQMYPTAMKTKLKKLMVMIKMVYSQELAYSQELLPKVYSQEWLMQLHVNSSFSHGHPNIFVKSVHWKGHEGSHFPAIYIIKISQKPIQLK